MEPPAGWKPPSTPEEVFNDPIYTPASKLAALQKMGVGAPGTSFTDKSNYGYGNFGDQAWNQAHQYDLLGQQLYGRAAPQMQAAGVDWQGGRGAANTGLTAQQQQLSRDQQMSYINGLQDQLAGRGAPSAAQLQLQQGADTALQSANALAASAGPQNAAAAQRAAVMQGAQLTQQYGNQAAQLRAQEQQQLRGELGSALGGLRSQDLSALGQASQNQQFSAGLQQQANLQNAGLQEQQNALGQQGLISMYGMGQDVLNTDLASRMHYQDLMAQKYANDKGLAQQASQFQTAENDKKQASYISAAATLAPYAIQAASDERLKTDIAPASSKDATEILDKLNKSIFKYKEPEKFGPGEHFGIMAQDLEKSRLGKTLVVNTPEGKMVDVKKAAMASLALLSALNERIRKVEARR